MDFYTDIQILSNPELSDTIVMNELFTRLHIVLVECGNNQVGVSFPKFQKNLGNVLRLHGSRVHIEKLMENTWIMPLQDYVSISGIHKVPERALHRRVQRIQVKSNFARLLRRSVRRGTLTQQEADAKASTPQDTKTLSLPFLKIKSLSTGQTFRLFVEHSPVVANPVTGTFSTYGFSSDATIPWF